MKNLKFTDLEMQDYLTTAKITIRQKKLAFKLRSRMGNFKNNMGIKIACQICEIPNTEDSQEHSLLDCDVLKMFCPSVNQNIQKANYSDLFNKDIEKIVNAVKLCDISVRKRQEILALIMPSVTMRRRIRRETSFSHH